jgi:hypothetical protein
MNFQASYQQGQEGRNRGLPTGLATLDKGINGNQRGKIVTVAAGPKCGKTTFVDYCFVLNAFNLSPQEDIEILYFSFEIDRINKEAKWVAHYMFKHFGINSVTINGKMYLMSAELIMGKITENGEVVRLTPELHEKVMYIHENYIVPLVGRYDERGNKLSVGRVHIIDQKTTVSEMETIVHTWALANGTFTHESYLVINQQGMQETRFRISGYTPNNPNKYMSVVTDHCRKPKLDDKQTLKQMIDAWAAAQVEFRNRCAISFINIIHLNRNLGNVERMKFAGEFLYPNGGDIKDSGNLSEESNIVITMFNPNDEQYGIKKHFGLQLRDANDAELFPNYRSIHIVESRETECPAHLQVNMFGNINYFESLNQG